jgi:hypothetical protein
MSESRKLLIGFGIVALLCLCAAGVSYLAFRQLGKQVENALNTDPTSIAKTQDHIAEFDIPPGYRPMAISLFNYDMVNLIPETSNSGMTIMMMQYTGLVSGNRKQLEQQLRQAAERQSNQSGVPMQMVDTREVSIRGETVIVTISEGDYQGFIMRQWTTVFQGNQGPTILMIQGPLNVWDDQLIDDFLKSIH